jgi:hypothetical protein
MNIWYKMHQLEFPQKSGIEDLKEMRTDDVVNKGYILISDSEKLLEEH